jgi:hypothetical protein
MTDQTLEISVKGKWVKVPAVDIDGRKITVKGKWLKVASIHDEWWLETELEDPQACVNKLKEQGPRRLRADVFTFMQKVPGTPPKHEYIMEQESVAAARTANFKEWWESLPQETRKNVRRSQKRGVTVAIKEFDDDLIRGIVGVNNESSMRQGVPNAHYGKTFDQVTKDHSSFLDRSDFICTYFENEIIGFLKIVYRGDVAAVLNLAVMSSHSDKRPANALIAKAVELCESKGASYLTYGRFNYGNKRDSPLREFKIRNGFEEVLTPRFYVPLTGWGKLCVKLGLHRGILGILPHGLITMGINARAKWYNFKRSINAPV